MIPPIFLVGTLSTSRQPTISGYQNITFDGFILTLCSSNIICNSSFVTFADSLIFFLTFDSCTVPISHLTVLFPHLVFFFSHLTILSFDYAVPTSHMTILLSYLVVPLFFFLTFNSFILHCAIPTSHVIVFCHI